MAEVQRTLVKSPPELWAELSDQESLARHLCDFGEIRITSIAAESAVHWESDEASGTALIKQAGWGTKVTLRATVRATDPEPVHETTASTVAAQGPASTMAAQSPMSSSGAPGPLTAAAMRDSVEPSAPSAWVAATGSGAPVETSRAPTREPAFTFGSARAPEPATAHEAPAFEDTENPPRDTREDGDPEPTRRGFFARLFGRRTRRPEDHDQTHERPAELDEPPAEPAPIPEAAEPTALEALQARFAVRPQVPETPSAPADPVIEESAATPSDVAPEPPAAEDLSPDPIDVVDASSDQTADTDSSDPTDGADLSSELRRAEEIGARGVRTTPTEDQVKEILTGVLDRLGAAHHRPFSRA